MAVEQKAVVVHLDENRCDGCRLCLPACGYGALLSVPGELIPYVDHWSCTGCGTCTTSCPLQALHMMTRETYR